VLLRNVQPADEALLARVCGGVRERGFINYFGLQRFGTGARCSCARQRRALKVSTGGTAQPAKLLARYGATSALRL
jgi:hypothetical protein